MFWICTDCTIVCYVKSFSSVSVCVQNNETHLSGWLGTVEFVAPEKIWSKGLNFQKQILQFSFLKGSFYHMNCAFSLEITKDKMEMESDEKSEWRHCRSIELNEDLCLGRVLGSLRESWKVPECPTAPLAARSSTLSHPFSGVTKRLQQEIYFGEILDAPAFLELGPVILSVCHSFSF